MKTLGILIAQNEEFDPLVKRLHEIQKIKGARYMLPGYKLFVARSGVGMTNSMVMASSLINDYHVDHIMNIGVASARGPLSIGDIVGVSNSYNGDFDISVFNHNKYYVPEVGEYIDVSKQGISSIQGMHCFPCFSVSKFNGEDMDTKLHTYLIDMEFYGVAHMCKCYNIPCSSIKIVSDKGKESNHRVYESSLSECCDKLAIIVTEILQDSSIFPRFLYNNVT